MRYFLKKYAAASCVALILTLGTGTPYAQDSSEYNVKAAYIYNFVKFVKWPAGMETESRSSIDICIVGDSDLLQAKSVFQQASGSKLSISLVQENSPANVATHCHIVFAGDIDSAKTKEVLAAVHGKPILTIGDSEEFVEYGGMIGFVMLDGKIKFVINPKPAMSSNLRIDARLLEIAIKVIGR